MANIIFKNIAFICTLLLNRYIIAAVDMSLSPSQIPRDLIIGGERANVNDYPWFAKDIVRDAAGDYYYGGCGGSLITPEYVLTAAHCNISSVVGYEIGAFCYEEDNCGQAYDIVEVARKYVHEGWNPLSLQYDFALMKLVQRVNITDPVKLDQGNISSKYSSNYRNLWTVGFGDTDPSSNYYYYPNYLHHVELAYVSQSTCAAQYAGRNRITSSMMCATDPGQDSCIGDSGGPLYDKNFQTLVGIVSFGPIEGCAIPGYPGVYSRIANQWTWIKTKVCGDHSSPKPDFCTQTTISSASHVVSWISSLVIGCFPVFAFLFIHF